jgi:mannose-6-phosphate isomerase
MSSSPQPIPPQQPSSQQPIGPLVLAPTPSERIWGVHSLEPWFAVKDLAKPVGEMWLTAEDCRIEGGAFAGQTLREVVHAAPQSFGGNGGFPLLIKILFPADKLSVQVHPNDAEAQATGEARGKTECWYVLSADPGATVAVGFRDKISVSEVREAIEAGTLEERMAHLPVKAGDMVFVDAGTVHAIGPGVIILETQEYSDITYRLFDYGRPRELHLERGLAVTRIETAAGLVAATTREDRTELVRSEYFVVDRFEASAELGCENELQILIALTEGSSVSWWGDRLALPIAHAVLLPAEGIAYHLETSAAVIRMRP